ncbi:penicillin binding protein PBP4B [Candidatus Colwellia aromaticivorans]|uniref:penicillin binding protein PBP4B n=1 Tax=Candidatus Colwellia aromaticivorans TaxID=2267621 RepID=UPI000DF43F78|nr:penicillin binding protein PBP4B [Candidatus Colwellia aromaticivorans]
MLLLASVALVFLTSCTSNTLPVEEMHSKNYGQRIKFLIMHYTGGDYQSSLQELVHKNSVSSHYLVPESHDKTYLEDELKVLKLVNENERAWHAGSSYWQGRTAINDQSIGIEIVNGSKCERLPQEQTELAIGQLLLDKKLTPNQICFFPDYDPKQIELLIELSKEILKKNPDISPTHIIGHSDIAPQRKNDPGPRFPWYQLYQAGIGAWYEKETVLKYWKLFDVQMPNIGLIQQALHRYGYGIEETSELDSQTQAVLHTFQMHFVPWKITDRADEQTVATLFALLEKYMPEQAQELLARYEHELALVKTTNTILIKNGQIDQAFPQQNRSSRALVNDRAIFKSYQGKGEIIIDNQDAISADIFINGEKLNIADPLQAYNSYQYSLKKRTKNGDNTFKIENVLPEGASVNITIPYPVLENQTSKHKQRFIKIDTLIKDDIEQGFPGAVLLVLKDGKIIKNTAYGYARKFADGGELLTAPVKMTTDTLFDIASNTKMFATNFALMKLVNEGKLDTSLPINHYLPTYRGAGRDLRTVKDILTHKAGYAPQVKFFTRDNNLGPKFFSHDTNKTKDLILTQVPFAVGRSTKRMYSDTDYMLLGMIIEKITGMSLDLYVEYDIYHPLGLNNTVFNPLQKGFRKNQFAATEIHGTTRGNRVSYENVRTYVLQGEVHDEKAYHSLAGVAGHAGLFSTAKDMAVLAQALLNRGGYGNKQLFSGKVIDQFVKPDDGNGTYGLGWRRANNGDRKWHFGPYASGSAYGHTGWTGTVTVIDPEHDLAIILLTNARHSEIEGDEKDYQFKGKQFETGNYGSVISLVYEAVLDN